MIEQLEMLKAMLVRNKPWNLEIELATGSPPSESVVAATIHKYASLGAYHSFPRMSLYLKNWGYDFHNGDCMETSGFQILVELERALPAKTTGALEEQYENVCQSLAEIARELSRLSYGELNPDNLNYLAQLKIDAGPAVLDDVGENEIANPQLGEQSVIWWQMWDVTPQGT